MSENDESLTDHRHGRARSFAVAAESTRVPMIFTDATGRDDPIVFANQSFLELAGCSGSRIIGRPFLDVLNFTSDPETRADIAAAMALGGEGKWDVQWHDPDGKEFLATVFLSPVYDEHGHLAHKCLSVVKTGHQVDRIVAQRDELHALFHQAPGFIAASQGPLHRFTFANASYKRFVGRDDLEGRTVAEALPEAASQGFVSLLDRVFATGEPFVANDVEFTFVDHGTGRTERRYADFVYQPVRAADGEITGVFCQGYDVTTQHETAEHLAELEADMIQVARANAMGTMAATLAHELNQPLSAIANYAQGAGRLAYQGGPDAQALTSALSSISDAANRASAIIRNLRDLTSGRTTSRTAFNLKAAVGECVRLVRAVGPLSVRFSDATPEHLTVHADRVQIQQVLINLLRNASEAVQSAGRQEVTVAAVKTDSRVVVSVSDTGTGVSAEAAATLFSLVDSTKTEGMGIGLSICRTILEAHGERIWLENSSACGTEFRFSLPLEA